MKSVVRITGIAVGGRGVGRIDGKVVFVPYTAPGDEALIEITSEKKGFSEGRLLKLLEVSHLRVNPACKYFGKCGGCSIQHISYPAQVEWKDRIFRETIERIGKTGPLLCDRPVPSPKEFGYRARARFHADGPMLGFYGAGSRRVVDIEECPALEPALNAALSGIRGAFRASGTDASALKDFEIAAGNDGKAAASFNFRRIPPKRLTRALGDEAGLKGFELNGALKGSVGDVALNYAASGIKFEFRTGVFCQANLRQNESLINKVLDYCALAGQARVIDLFSGAGNITLPLAREAREITGVESNGEAVRLAIKNASFNAVTSARFVKEDAAVWLGRNIKALEKERPLVVILDPPRSGAPEAARLLSALKPQKIIYISCDPPTLARDISVLTASGYMLLRTAILDMFPQTFHIESVSVLELKK